MKTFLIWNNQDANNSFEIEAENATDAALVALGELGYSVSAEPVKSSDDEN